jgi:hypothetical protein
MLATDAKPGEIPGRATGAGSAEATAGRGATRAARGATAGTATAGCAGAGAAWALAGAGRGAAGGGVSRITVTVAALVCGRTPSIAWPEGMLAAPTPSAVMAPSATAIVLTMLAHLTSDISLSMYIVTPRG